MSKSNHAISASGGGYCVNCQSPVGEKVKVQPTLVDGETFCARCFVWERMAAEPGRFNASQSCVTHCGFCGWTAVCFGALPGQGLRCGACGRYGAVRLKLSEQDLEGIAPVVRHAQAEAAKAIGR